MQQCRKECPVAGGEPWAGVSELAFKYHDLVAQQQDFHVLVPFAHGQRAQQGERVGHTETDQLEQHSWSSCRVRLGAVDLQSYSRAPRLLTLSKAATCMDEVLGRHNA